MSPEVLAQSLAPLTPVIEWVRGVFPHVAQRTEALRLVHEGSRHDGDMRRYLTALGECCLAYHQLESDWRTLCITSLALGDQDVWLVGTEEEAEEVIAGTPLPVIYVEELPLLLSKSPGELVDIFRIKAEFPTSLMLG